LAAIIHILSNGGYIKIPPSNKASAAFVVVCFLNSRSDWGERKSLTFLFGVPVSFDKKTTFPHEFL
jgi:hypothetical protein